VSNTWGDEQAYYSALKVYKLLGQPDRLGLLRVPGLSDDVESAARLAAGKHLLEVVISHWGEGEATRWRHWRDAKRAIDRILDYVRWYYVDLDDCVEWSRYQYLAGPEMRACYLKAVPRLEMSYSLD